MEPPPPFPEVTWPGPTTDPATGTETYVMNETTAGAFFQLLVQLRSYIATQLERCNVKAP